MRATFTLLSALALAQNALAIEGYPADYDNADFPPLGSHNSSGLSVRKNDPSPLGVDVVKQYSGYLDDNDKDKHHFYWLFESRNKPATDPVVFYVSANELGCSSMTSIFAENGPAFYKDQAPKPDINPYSLNANATVLYMDAICNSGFSYCAENDSTDADQAKAMHTALKNFFTNFPEYAKQDFVIAGQGEMAHWVPALAADIISARDSAINLKGISLGNTLIDPEKQLPQTGPMACGAGGVGKLLKDLECAVLDDVMKTCVPKIHKCYDTHDAQVCGNAQASCNHPWFKIYRSYQDPATGTFAIGMRNLLHPDENFDPVASYYYVVSTHETKKILGVPSDPFRPGSFNDCYFPTFGLWDVNPFAMQPVYRDVAKVLDKIRVLIYAGDYDWLRNWLGMEAATNALHWRGRADFVAAGSRNLTVAGRAYASVRSSGHLSFARVFHAGNDVPRYEPQGFQNLLGRFVADTLSAA